MIRKRENKNCDECLRDFDCLFRCKTNKRLKWIFVCRICLTKLKKENSEYKYGGTWKRNKKF